MLWMGEFACVSEIVCCGWLGEIVGGWVRLCVVGGWVRLCVVGGWVRLWLAGWVCGWLGEIVCCGWLGEIVCCGWVSEFVCVRIRAVYSVVCQIHQQKQLYGNNRVTTSLSLVMLYASQTYVSIPYPVPALSLLTVSL